MHDRKLTGKKKGRHLLQRSEERQTDKSATERMVSNRKKSKDTGTHHGKYHSLESQSSNQS